MNNTFSPTLGSLQPSLTLGITAKAKAMKAAGEDVVSLCAGEPDFDTADHIKQAAIDSLNRGETKYTPAAGRPDLRKAVAEKLVNENGVPSTADQVVVAPGAKYSVFTAIAVLCQPGDEVLIPTPCWLSYPEMVNSTGAKPVFVPATLENEFCATADAIRAAATEKTRLLILNTPSNPTGGIYSRDQLAAIAEVAKEFDFMILADEIYEKLVYDADHSHVSIASLSDDAAGRTITVNGFSKAYSMTGWRLGYLSAPLPVAKRIIALQSHTTSNPTSFAQAGALAALNGDQNVVETMRQAFAERREIIYQRLADIPGVNVFKPRGAFYIFPDISSFGIDSMTFAERLLNEKKLAVIPGMPFQADTCIRLSYACSMETIEDGLARFAEFCAELNE